MMRQIEKVALACGLLLALACGGESDSDDGNEPNGGGGSGAVDTGLPEATPLREVTAEQYSNACESLRQDVEARLGPDIATRGVCEAYGAALVDAPAQCRSTADTCVQQANAGTQPFFSREDVDFTNFECGDVGDLQDCSVTVGEFETCVDDQIEAFETLISDNNCANAASVSLADLAALMNLGATSPPSCANVQQQCPGIGPFGAL
jgi:hypothetical protein